MKKTIDGFTIVELIVIISVIGILATIGIVSYSAIQTRVRDSQRVSQISIIQDALEKYYSKNGEYPSCANITASTVTANTLKGLDPSALIAPKATSGTTNSILTGCGGITDATTADVFAYTIASATPACTTGLACPQYTLQYKEESTGKIISIVSRHQVKSWLQMATDTGSCAISSNNQAYCWGHNIYGNLGNGSVGSISTVPVAIYTAGVLNGKTIKQISVGDIHSCAIASDDQVYCWGYNVDGELGNNSTTNSSIPVAVYTAGVLNGKTIKSISVGFYHTCVIASDDQVYCWGGHLGRSDLLGNNSANSSPIPVAVDTTGVLKDKTILAIATSYDNTCAIASDNQVYCWGNGSFGQSGDGHTNVNLVPVAVDTTGVLKDKTILAIAAGNAHTCAIASDNQVYCWGQNYAGSLGNNLDSQNYVPVAVYTAGVLNGKTIKSVAAGHHTTCVVASDNSAYCWGYNVYGELGNNSTADSSIPVAVINTGSLSGKTIASISVGVGYTCAITSDGQASCWGWNSVGNFGNNTVIDSLVPVAVVTPS